MAKDDRFEKVYSQGTLNVMEIWVDKETGVNYVNSMLRSPGILPARAWKASTIF